MKEAHKETISIGILLVLLMSLILRHPKLAPKIAIRMMR
jgi:hypothetical protein